MKSDDDFRTLLVKYHKFWYLRPSAYLNELKQLPREQIVALSERQREILLSSWDDLVWNENVELTPVIEKLLARQNVLRNIRSELLFPQWVMDRFKEACDQCVRGEWISSIALCGAIVEFVVGELFEVEEYKQRIPARDRKRGNNANLLVLRAYKILHEDDYERLDDVRKIRNSYVHPEKLHDIEPQRADNLTVLSKLCEFFAEANMKRYPAYFFYASQLMRKLTGPRSS